MLVWCMLCLLYATPSGVSAWTQNVTQLHLMFMNHLDVGFSLMGRTGFSINVINTYFTQYFPRALKVAEDLRSKGYSETFSYMTQPWLLQLYFNCPPNTTLVGIPLQCPNAKEKAAVRRGIQEGVIQWHAGAMNLQYEVTVSSSVLNMSLSLSQLLDKEFDIHRQFSVLSLRDVPGLTSAVVPHFARAGIAAVVNGINWACPPAYLGGHKLVRWKVGDFEVLYHQIPGGYPDIPGPDPAHPGGLDPKNCLLAPGSTEALCWVFRSDNRGPPDSYQEVLDNYEVLRNLFPNAHLFASTLERFYSLVIAHREMVPEFRGEIGDTWLQGDQSDFKKIAIYRAVVRALDTCLREQKCSLSSSDMRQFALWLVKLPEHTYGINSVLDSTHYSNADFSRVRFSNKYFLNAVTSWREQRQFLDLAIKAASPYLRSLIKTEVEAIDQPFPHLQADFDHVSDSWFCKGFQFDVRLPEGLKQWLVDLKTWDGPRVVYSTYNETDTEKFMANYSYVSTDNTGMGKFNSTVNADPQSKHLFGTATDVYRHKTNCLQFAIRYIFNDPEGDKYGAPSEVWMLYEFRRAPTTGYDLTTFVMDKKPTRLMEALYVQFPGISTNQKMTVSKLDQNIDISQVVLNGSLWQHFTSTVDMFSGTNHMAVRSLDASVACPMTPAINSTVWPVPLITLPPNSMSGVSYNLLNNIWDVNFIFWYPFEKADANFTSRFQVDVSFQYEAQNDNVKDIL